MNEMASLHGLDPEGVWGVTPTSVLQAHIKKTVVFSLFFNMCLKDRGGHDPGWPDENTGNTRDFLVFLFLLACVQLCFLIGHRVVPVPKMKLKKWTMCKRQTDIDRPHFSSILGTGLSGAVGEAKDSFPLRLYKKQSLNETG